MAIVVTDSFAGTNDSFWMLVTNPGSADQGVFGYQSFTPSATGTLHDATFQMRKTGSPTDAMYCYCYAHSGTYGTSSVPTGSPLATASALSSSASTSTGSFVFTFDDTVTLTADTPYVIGVYFDGGVNATDYLRLYFDSSASPGHGGNSGKLMGTYGAAADRDLNFVVQVTEPEGPDMTAPIITVAGVTDGYNNVGPVTITFSATDAVDGSVTPTATIDGSAFTSGSAVSANGIYTLVVTATDAAFNTATTTIDFALRDLDASGSSSGTPTVTHAFVSSGYADDASDATLSPSDWNADHTFTGGLTDSFTDSDGNTYTITNGVITSIT